MEQSYKQVKQSSLGWAQYQVRSDLKVGPCDPPTLAAGVVLRLLVLLVGFLRRAPPGGGRATRGSVAKECANAPTTASEEAGRGKKEDPEGSPRELLAVLGGAEESEGVAGTVGDGVALLEGVLRQAPTRRATSFA